jgi:hypothetical protein
VVGAATAKAQLPSEGAQPSERGELLRERAAVQDLHDIGRRVGLADTALHRSRGLNPLPNKVNRSLVSPDRFVLATITDDATADTPPARALSVYAVVVVQPAHQRARPCHGLFPGRTGV